MYSSKLFRDNLNGTVDFFANYIYPQPALQPQYNRLAANFSSIPIVAPTFEFMHYGRLYVILDKATESRLINQIAIYKLIDNEWSLFKVLPVEGAVTKRNVELELDEGHYVATLIDRFRGPENLF